MNTATQVQGFKDKPIKMILDEVLWAQISWNLATVLRVRIELSTQVDPCNRVLHLD